MDIAFCLVIHQGKDLTLVRHSPRLTAFHSKLPTYQGLSRHDK